MDRMKRVSAKRGIVHVETPNGIVNIYVGLTDAIGRAVDIVQIIPNKYVGEARVMLRGLRLVRCKRAKVR